MQTCILFADTPLTVSTSFPVSISSSAFVPCCCSLSSISMSFPTSTRCSSSGTLIMSTFESKSVSFISLVSFFTAEEVSTFFTMGEISTFSTAGIASSSSRLLPIFTLTFRLNSISLASVTLFSTGVIGSSSEKLLILVFAWGLISLTLIDLSSAVLLATILTFDSDCSLSAFFAEHLFSRNETTGSDPIRASPTFFFTTKRFFVFLAAVDRVID
mmetsp:Transcript_37409/g.41333  ORF Transcript_37409/g.41333 Transcript_37409/m.41333 type:complete len:215 (-) Transcript_37409:522-1166(-)